MWDQTCFWLWGTGCSYRHSLSLHYPGLQKLKVIKTAITCQSWQGLNNLSANKPYSKRPIRVLDHTFKSFHCIILSSFLLPQAHISFSKYMAYMTILLTRIKVTLLKVKLKFPQEFVLTLLDRYSNNYSSPSQSITSRSLKNRDHHHHMHWCHHHHHYKLHLYNHQCHQNYYHNQFLYNHLYHNIFWYTILTCSLPHLCSLGIHILEEN